MQSNRWQIDSGDSTVLFTATSSVHQIHASGSASGWFEAAIDERGFKPDQALGGHLEIPVANLSSGNSIIDREMQRRVDSGAHPIIAAGIETTEELNGSSALLTGTIQFQGIETLVEGELHLRPGPRLTGIGEFDTRWWGLEPPRIFMFRVQPIVTVEIDLALIPDPR